MYSISLLSHGSEMQYQFVILFKDIEIKICPSAISMMLWSLIYIKKKNTIMANPCDNKEENDNCQELGQAQGAVK